ncbi:ParB N-terminal domain-containing protein [Tunturiibacter gelidiferens]|uniref:ParB N-terminal domain-containing protein n=1 Tax=Tunturiibacter gelidiferens TaxID=3069689 RepID=UPI003D9BFD4C
MIQYATLFPGHTTEQSFEIVAGARRYRAAQMAEAATVPVRIVNLTDAEAMEAL